MFSINFSEYSLLHPDLKLLVTPSPFAPYSINLNDYNLPYSDPYHAIVVHFVIAPVVIAIVFDTLGAITRRQSLFNAGWWNLVLATLAIAVAVVLGQFEASMANPSQAAQPILDRHMIVGWSVAAILLNFTIWRGILRYHPPLRVSILYLGAGLLVVGLVTYQVYLGTKLVWVHGLHVKPVVIAKREAMKMEAVSLELPSSTRFSD